MGIRTYRTAGTILGLIKDRIGMRIRVTGDEHLVDRPSLYVVNHFTRFETLVVPYVLYEATRHQVRTLANDGLFKGALGRFLRSCGVVSTRDPRRDEIIVHDLMTGKFDWVIYPEGGLVKNKRVVDRGRHELDLPHRKGPPHTGAAILALRAELGKRVYRRACDTGDRAARERLERRYRFTERTDVCEDATVIVPVTITYHPMRTDRTTFTRLFELLRQPMNERTIDELRTEGSLLLNPGEMNIHFSPPIDAASYLGGTTGLARRAATVLSSKAPEEVMLRSAAVRMTRDFMARIYGNTEINIEHLLATALRQSRADRIGVSSLHRTLYLVANELSVDPTVRVHPSLRGGIAPLLTDCPYRPLERAIELARTEGVLSREGDHYHVRRELLEPGAPFQRIRLSRMMTVIANEVEPVVPVIDAMRRHLRASDQRVVHRLPEIVAARDRRDHLEGVRARPVGRAGEAEDSGAPFLLEGRRGGVGVILVHGYLARPEEMRPLGDSLHQMGHTVYGVRLEGHGTHPEDLLSIEWSSWINSIRRAYAALDARCDRIVIGGLSLGGILALCFAATKDEQIDGIFTINAPIKLRDSRVGLAPLLVQVDRILRAARITSSPIHSRNTRSESPDINYGVNYVTGVRELRRAILNCRRILRRITAPALIIQSDADPVVRPISAELIHRGIGSDTKRLLQLPSDRHIIVRGDQGSSLADLVGEFVTGVGARPARS